MNISKDIVIIGAGITGLTTAHCLKKEDKNFVVLEKQNRVGGVIKTEKNEDFLWEEGPNSALLSNTAVVHLFDDLKDSCEIELANEKVKKRYVLKNGKWHALPSGIFSAIGTPLFKMSDKFKVLGEPFKKPGDQPEENLKDLVERRLGKSFLDYAIDPFILGVYAGDPQMLIPKYALPKLYNLEQDYGSFIKGAIKKKKEPKTEDEKRANKSVYSVKGGLSELTRAVYESAGKQNFILDVDGIKVELVPDGFVVKGTKNGERITINTKKVITTTDSLSLAEILPFVEDEDMKNLSSLPYAKVIEVALGFKNWDGMELDAFGGLIPFKENKDVLGVMFMSALVSGRAPKGGALFSIFAGGIRKPHIVKMTDEEIISLIEKETKLLLNCSEFKPDLLKIVRHTKAIPQYGKESKARFETVAKLQEKHTGLYIGGNLIGGIGMADRILQGTQLANL